MVDINNLPRRATGTNNRPHNHMAATNRWVFLCDSV